MPHVTDEKGNIVRLQFDKSEVNARVTEYNGTQFDAIVIPCCKIDKRSGLPDEDKATEPRKVVVGPDGHEHYLKHVDAKGHQWLENDMYINFQGPNGRPTWNYVKGVLHKVHADRVSGPGSSPMRFYEWVEPVKADPVKPDGKKNEKEKKADNPA